MNPPCALLGRHCLGHTHTHHLVQHAQRHAQLHSSCGVLARGTSPAPTLGVTDDPPGGRTPAGWAQGSDGAGAATQPQARGLHMESPWNPVLTHHSNRPADVQTGEGRTWMPKSGSLLACVGRTPSGKAKLAPATPLQVRSDLRGSGPAPQLTTLRPNRLGGFIMLPDVFEALGCSILTGRTSKAASPTRPFFRW